ncbi:MAG: DUF2330 domain-containing protein [Myxococcaceae bacterium]|jgi:hypothetical protein|nr:DUF2330 domain-containing protein [Myxococcaceae bacterium]
MLRSCLLVAGLLLGPAAHAFCGFYVSSAGGQLFNDATMVVLMREGTRTVLSMQNTYRGPPADFAMVVPVPVVLQRENVRTLPKDAFDRLDALASPRLVQMCVDDEGGPRGGGLLSAARSADIGGLGTLPRDLGVKVEARFEVNEYDVVILSAKDALGLDIWLRENKYQIPANAEPLLRPYVQNASKFFVAKVNTKKVKFVNGQAVLSPLRVHYDSEKFELPIRLGLVNTAGEQDLIVHVIARGRYEVANRPNVMIPTNLDVKVAVEPRFGAFYSELVKRTFAKTPNAAVTEFAWQGAMPPPQVMVDQGIYGVTCDPCPPPHPMDDPLTRLLGADVIPGVKGDSGVGKWAAETTLTRLHLRSTKDGNTDDLVFKQAEAVEGGVPGVPEVRAAKKNRFQGRYVMWKRGDACWDMASPIVSAGLAGTNAVLAAPAKLDQAFEAYLVSSIPQLGVEASGWVKPTRQTPAPSR